MKIHLLIIFLISLLSITDSKIVSRTFYKQDLQSGDKTLFITKFDFGQRGGNIRLHAIRRFNSIDKQLKLLVDIVLDQHHSQYKSSPCQSRHPHTFRTQQLYFQPNAVTDLRTILIPPLPTEHIHYIYFAKCQHQGDLLAQNQVQNNQNQGIEFEITLYNDGSHFGEDEKMLTGYLVVVGIQVVLIVKFAIPIGKSIMSSNDKTKISVFTGLIVLGFSYFYRLLHLLIYHTNGQGIYFFQILYIVLKTPCQFVIVTVIVAVGWGWSITHLSYDQSYIVAGVASGLINTICLIVNVSAEEMVDIHHKYDSTAGNILLVLRIVILVIFILGVLKIYNRQSASIRKFMKKLGAVGGLYLASWPLTVLFAEFFLPNYMHNQVITFVQEITHLLATWLLCSMFAHPESTYRKISIKEEDDPLRMQNYKRK